MPDPIADITLGASILGIPSPLSGSLDIDAVTGLLVSSSLQLDVAGVQVPLLDVALSTNPTTGITTVTGSTLASGLGTGVTLTFTGTSPPTVTTSISALGAPVVTNTLSATAATVCYCTGTRIRTTRGDVAVEDLRVGDLAVTASGEQRPIRWIGHRVTETSRYTDPHLVMPVRVCAHAFGEGRPARDLRLSPGHALCLDLMGEVLIPVMALINGSTVVQEEVESVTYWHVELDRHDILLAENMPAESYLDMANRRFFAEGDVVDILATPDGEATSRTHADFCRPFYAAGSFVAVARQQLQRRLPELGWRLEQLEPWDGVALLVDGRRVVPKTRGLSACFELPAQRLEEAGDVWLVSPTGVASAISDSRDDRALGLCLAAVVIDDGLGAPRAVALDDPKLGAGFHEMQGDHRWTAGRARLPVELIAGMSGTMFLRLDLHAPPLRRWAAPEAGEYDAAAEDRTAPPALRLVS